MIVSLILHVMHLMSCLAMECSCSGYDWNFRGKIIYEPPRFMSIRTAIEQLLEVEANKRGDGKTFMHPSSFFLAVVTLSFPLKLISFSFRFCVLAS